MDAIRIGVVGDYQDGNETHLALGPAADHAAERAGLRATTTWIATPEPDGTAEQVLGDLDALWIAPGSPYRSMRGALEAITYARTRGVPLAGPPVAPPMPAPQAASSSANANVPRPAPPSEAGVPT